MTRAVERTPADVLREARRRDSDRKRDRVFRTVDAMKRDGTPISFAAVARSAKVSHWLVYADGVREYLETARLAQAGEPAQAQRPGRSASEASWRTDLELAKQDNRRLPVKRSASRRPYGNASAPSWKPNQLSRLGGASMNSLRPMIATAAKIAGWQQNSMTRVSGSG